MASLMTPGPTEIPLRVLRAMTRGAVTPGDPEYVRIWDETERLLQKLMKTESAVLHFPGSGRVSIEAAFLSVLEPGDKVLTINNGVFGKWLRVIAERVGGEVVEINQDPRRSIDPEDVRGKLEEDEDIKVVAAVHNETSTGVRNPIDAIAKTAKDRGALFLADTVSSTGGDVVETDKWNIDLNCTCSYKCFGSPAGLSIVSVSQDAWRRMEERKKPAGSFAFDLYRWLQMWIPKERGGKLIWGYRRHPIEPAPHITFALNEALKAIFDLGLEERIRRNVLAGRALRAGIRAMGLELYPLREEYASNTVTGVKVPEGLEASEITTVMKREHGVIISDGLEEFHGKVLRIAHMGIASDEMHILKSISALEKTLIKLGYKVAEGAGQGAVMETYNKEK